MTSPIEYLGSRRYPGRFIVLGQTSGRVMAIYGCTGRSASSLARKYVQDEHGDVWSVGVSDVVKTEGNPELLEYRALKWQGSGFVVANGRQIEGGWETCDPEPDEYKTPRITGVVADGQVTLFISRDVGGMVERKRWPLVLEDGKAYFVSTYSGEDVRPTKSFAGEPVPVEFDFVSPSAAAKVIFDSLTPDYQVGVVGVFITIGGERELAIVNKL